MEDWEVLITVWKKGRVQGTFRYDHSPVTLGASSDNDVVLSDKEVSSSHGRLTVSRERLSYRDFSTNGTFVAGRRVVESVLGPEDRLEIPPFEIRSLLLKMPGSRRTVLRPVSDLIATIDPSRPALPSQSLGLLIVRGPADREGDWLEIPEGPQCIGRSEGADLRFEVPTLSRLHAVVQHVGGHGYTIQDLASSNGVFVNGQRTPVADLEKGDEVRLGSELILRLESRSAETRDEDRASGRDVSSDTGQDLLEVRVREIEKHGRAIVVFELSGLLTGDHAARSLTAHLDRAMELDRPLVAIGLDDLGELDRIGLATLAKALDTIEKMDGNVRIFGAPPAVTEVVDRSRMKVLFKGRIDSDEASAISALCGDYQDSS